LYTDEIGAATTSAYTIPTSAGQYFPNTLTGALTVECETYEDEEYTASRGSVTANVTLTLPSDKAPTCSTTLSKAWVDGVDAGAQFDVYVQGKGGVRVQTSATAMYGATIAAYSVTCEGKAYTTADATHKPFTGSGSVKVYTTVTDSRGVVSTTQEDTLTVIPWKPPQISAFSVQRVDANGNPLRDGVRMKATIKATANSITVSAAEENSIEFQIEYREKGAATWTEAKAVSIAGISVDGGYVLQDALGVDITDFDDMKGYDFVLALSDIYAASTATTQIATSEIIADFNTTDNGVAIGGESTGEKFESYKPAHFYDGISQLGYSLMETYTGAKWIDGKPIYRQVYRIPPTTANGQTKNVSLGHPFSYYGTIVRVYGITTGNAQIKPLPHVDMSTYYILMDLQSMTSGDPYFRIICASAASMPGGGYAIVEYTIPSRNLAYNNGFLLGSDGWTLHANSVVDTGKTLFGCSSVKVTESGNAADVWRGMLTLSTSRIPSVAGDVWMGSAYVFVQDYTTFAGSAVAVEVSYYNAAGTCLVSRAGVLFPTSAHNGKWTRIAVTDTTPAPADTASVGIFMYVRRNGTCWFACPQLEKDTVVTDWVP